MFPDDGGAPSSRELFEFQSFRQGVGYGVMNESRCFATQTPRSSTGVSDNPRFPGPLGFGDFRGGPDRRALSRFQLGHDLIPVEWIPGAIEGVVASAKDCDTSVGVQWHAHQVHHCLHFVLPRALRLPRFARSNSRQRGHSFDPSWQPAILCRDAAEMAAGEMNSGGSCGVAIDDAMDGRCDFAVDRGFGWMFRQHRDRHDIVIAVVGCILVGRQFIRASRARGE